jgi:pimeloyl-ACP methyl ester carboxylesterase
VRDGCAIHDSVTGRRPVALFIQRVGVHGSDWRPRADAIASDCTCITFDRRGVGRSQPVGDALTVTCSACRCCARSRAVAPRHVVADLGAMVEELAGRAMASAIPGTRFIEIAGASHGLP